MISFIKATGKTIEFHKHANLIYYQFDIFQPDNHEYNRTRRANFQMRHFCYKITQHRNKIDTRK